VRATYALPRWYGKPGDWERLTRESSDRLGGKDGDIVYYMVASHVYRTSGKDFWPDGGTFDWFRMKRGFDQVEALYGIEEERLNEGCRIALTAGDYPTAHQWFKRIGNNWSPEIWESKEYFEKRKAEMARIMERKS